jgi:hypothetical protein
MIMEAVDGYTAIRRSPVNRLINEVLDERAKVLEYIAPTDVFVGANSHAKDPEIDDD